MSFKKHIKGLDALEKKIDWIQIDIGFLSEQEKDTVLNLCGYAVVNGSHTVMGEIMGGKSKPIIGICLLIDTRRLSMKR